MTDTG